LESLNSIVELVDINLLGHGGRVIFENLNFGLPEGKTAVISGPTGSGKTQLLNLIVGNIKPDSGSVFVFGSYIKSTRQWQLSKIRKKIGGVGGIFNLISYQTVYENLIHPLILNKKLVRFQKQKIEQVMNRFGILSNRNELAGNLSQGEKNETMLARAIIADQPLLLIDEPLSGVDPDTSEKIKRHLVRLSTAGHSMIILTCDPDRLGIADAINYKIKNGGLV